MILDKLFTRFFSKKYDFMGARKKAFLLSVTVVSLAIVILFGRMALKGNMLNYGIDFMGGTQIKIEVDKKVKNSSIVSALKKLGYEEPNVTEFGDTDKNQYLIKMRSFSSLSDDNKKLISKSFKDKYKMDLYRVKFSGSGDQVKLRFHRPVNIKEFIPIFKKHNLVATIPKITLSPIAKEYLNNVKTDKTAKWENEEVKPELDYLKTTYISPAKNEYTIILESITQKLEVKLKNQLNVNVEVLSIESRGPQVGKRLRIQGILSLLYALGFILFYIILRFEPKFAPGAVIALIHDVLITVGIFSLFNIEFSLPILAALLTIVGYSLNDTIVVYDRIRENIIKLKSKPLDKIINVSINETLSRTFITSLTTFLSVSAIYVLSGEGVLRHFALAMGIGIIVGTYSSIFVASPLVIWFNNKFSKLINTEKIDTTKKISDDFKDLYEEKSENSKDESSEKDSGSENKELTEDELLKKEIKKAKRQKRKKKRGRR
jgi:preprotein translocase subunit SecF